MNRPSLLRLFQHWFLFLAMAAIAVACGGRSDEGLLPPDLDASIDGANRDGGDSGVNRDGAGGADGGDSSVNRDGAPLPDGARPDGAGGAGGGTGPGDGGGGRLPDGGTTATLVRITLDPPTSQLGVATTQPLKVTGVYSDGSTMDITQQGVTFASSSPATCTVSGSGVVTAVAAGMSTITATRQPENLTATASVTVTQATVVSIAVTPMTQTIGVGGSVNFTATATMSDGTHQDVTSTVTWSSSDTTVASMTNAGLAAGVAAGMTTIKATMPVGGVSGTATLTVTASPLVSIAITPMNPILPIGVNFAFKATATYANGMTGDVTNSVVWSSGTPAVGTIGAATGMGTTVAAGTSTITASLTQGGMMVSGTTTLTVTAAKLVSITVTPAMSTVIVGLKQQLTASGRYDNNTTVDVTQSVSWSSSNASSAFVSTAAGSQGLVSGLAAGMATITATLNGVSGTAMVTVVEAKLVSITISPAAPSVPNGATIPLTANGTYDNGLMADVTTLVTWSTDNTTVATISNAQGTNGQVTGRSKGTTVVKAVSGAISAQATLTVTDAVPQTVEVAPANPNVQITRTQQMTATAVYTDGSRVDVTTLATWTTGRAATATVSNGAGSQGVVTAVAVGTTTVTATWSGLMGSTNITVTPAIPTSITVTPFEVTIATGGTQNYTAVVIYDIGTQATVTGQCMWSSTNTAVATIALGGGGGGGGGMAATARGLGGGDTTITCTYTAQGVTVSGTATLHVTPPIVPVSLNITPDPATVTTNGTISFVATVTMSNGTTQTVTQQASWTSSDATIAGVATAGAMGRGVATGLKPGMVTITATYNNGGVTVTATASLTVDGTPTGVTITAASDSLSVGGQQAYTTTLNYSDMTTRNIPANSTEMVCTSSDPNIAVIEVTGNTRNGRCLAAGMVTFTCTYTPTGSTTSVSGTAPLTCQDQVPDHIDVVPGTATLAQGDTQQYRATAVFTTGTTTTLDITTNANASWSSSNDTIATLSNATATKGLAQTVAQGTVTVTVSFRGVQGTATLTVGPVAPTGLVISPTTTSSFPPGGTQQFDAILQMSDKTTQTVTNQANWTLTSSTDAGSIGTITNGATRGYFTAGTSGSSGTITATYTANGTPFTANVRITVN